MKTFFLRLCSLGLFIGGAAWLSAQENLLIKTISDDSGLIYMMSVAFSPDGTYIASGGIGDTLKIRNVADGLTVKTLAGHRSFINSVAFSPDGKSLASAGEDGVIKIWDARTGDCSMTLKGHSRAVSSVVFFPDGKRLASGSEDGTVRLWRTGSKTSYMTIKTLSGAVASIAVSADGGQLASGSAVRGIKLWDAASGRLITTLEGHGAAVNSLSFAGTGSYLASGSADATVKIWRLSDGICVNTLTGRQQQVFAVLYSADGNYVFSGGEDALVSAWETGSGRVMREYSGHAGRIKSLALSPDGKFLASGSLDRTIKLWLTPWEAERREKEMKGYDRHYAAGVALLSSPTRENLKLAIEEFRQALAFKSTAVCEEKFKEASDALRRKDEEIKRNITLGVTGLLVFSALFIVFKLMAAASKKVLQRKNLPGEIKNETLSGNYENASKLYARYKAIGGKPEALPQEELLELYRGLQALTELPKEDLPYTFLLSYAVAIAKEGNYKLALTMLRSGRLLDEFKTPEEFGVFADIYRKAGSQESILMLKLGPDAYSSLAEAFFKVGDHGSCEKICALKKQFYAAKMSPRDAELLALSQKTSEGRKEAVKTAVRLRCINCGYVQEGSQPPAACPKCARPGDNFVAVIGDF